MTKKITILLLFILIVAQSSYASAKGNVSISYTFFYYGAKEIASEMCKVIESKDGVNCTIIPTHSDIDTAGYVVNDFDARKKNIKLAIVNSYSVVFSKLNNSFERSRDIRNIAALYGQEHFAIVSERKGVRALEHLERGEMSVYINKGDHVSMNLFNYVADKNHALSFYSANIKTFNTMDFPEVLKDMCEGKDVAAMLADNVLNPTMLAEINQCDLEIISLTKSNIKNISKHNRHFSKESFDSNDFGRYKRLMSSSTMNMLSSDSLLVSSKNLDDADAARYAKYANEYLPKIINKMQGKSRSLAVPKGGVMKQTGVATHHGASEYYKR